MMISTSILYCNKLDALPLTGDHTLDSTCSNSLSNSYNSSSGRFRVRYLGSNSCNLKSHKLKDGISAFQKSLLDLYTTTRRRSIALRSFYPFSLNQVIDVCSYGVVVAERDPTIIRINRNEAEAVVTKVITPLSNILLWAAVRFNSRVSGKRRVFGAAFVPLSCSDAVLNKNSFIPLSSKQRFLVGLPHPPLFVCVLQKVSNPRELECHLIVCASAEDSISLCSLLSDTQKNCSKIGALELPFRMGNYSYKSSSRMSRSTADDHIRSVPIDTQSDSSRVGAQSFSVSSYRSRFTPTSPSKSKYQFRPQQQQQQQQQLQQQQLQQQKAQNNEHQKEPYERRDRVEDIHTKNLPQISVEHNKTALQLRDYRSRSYRYSDNTQTPTATPTTSSSSERHNNCNHQRYKSRNNCKNGLLCRRDVKQMHCNCEKNDNNIAINGNNRNLKHSQKNVKRFVTNLNNSNSNAINRNIRDDNEVTSVRCKCSTSSDSGEPKLGTKANISLKSGHIMRNRDSSNYKFNNDHNSNAKEIMNTSVIRDKSNVRNYIISNESNNYLKTNAKLRDCKRNSVHRKHHNHDINRDSSLESSSNSEIVVKDNVKRVLDNKHLLSSNKVNRVKVPNVVKSPQRRYFGDTIRGAKSFEILNNSSSSDEKNSITKKLVQVRNATTSCNDAPWICNKDNKSMTVSKTLFLSSESDSKKSSSMSQISSDSITKINHTKSSPNLIDSRDEFHFSNASEDKKHKSEAQLHSNYKHISNTNTRLQSSRSGSPFARDNRVAIYLPEMKCVKSFNSRTDVKQWSTLSLSSNFEANTSANKSAPFSRPDLSYRTALPVLDHETLSKSVPLISKLNSPEYKPRNQSSLLARLRRMSIRSWLNASRGTSRFLLRFKSKRKRRKRYSNPSTDSAIDVDINDFRPEAQIYSIDDQNRGHIRRQHSWSFHDFTRSYPKHMRENKVKQCVSSETSFPSLRKQKIAESAIEVNDNKSCHSFSQLNRECIASSEILVHKPKAKPLNQSNHSNGEVRPLENNMSSDSGMDEIDCLSSTDVTNSINSRRKPLNEKTRHNSKNEWQRLRCKSPKQQLNRIPDKRKPFRHWSQTNLEQELGYMP